MPQKVLNGIFLPIKYILRKKMTTHCRTRCYDIHSHVGPLVIQGFRKLGNKPHNLISNNSTSFHLYKENNSK